jgi:phosphate starvation-inducible protein PhoH
MKNKHNSTKDNSLRIEQRDKIAQPFEIRPFKWTEKQQKLIDVVLDKTSQVIFIKSPPGTGKTLLSVYCSLVLLNKKSLSEVLFVRNPIESCSKSIGFLPAEKESKLDVYATPLYDHLIELLDKPTQEKLLKDERIKIDSVGFLKGVTFHNKAIICDEAEDLNLNELRLILGRLGRFSKLFIIGDEHQSNIKDSAFLKIFNLFSTERAKEQGIYTFEFTSDDCMRNNIMKFILGELDKLK